MNEKNPADKFGEKTFDQKDLRQIVADFEEIYDIRNLVEREYKLVQKSKEFDGSLEEYRRMFEIYDEIRRQSHWTSYFKKLAQIIQAFGFVVIVITAIKFGWDASDRHRKHLFENWDIVALDTDAKGIPIKVSRGRKEALEYLNDRGADLSRLQAQDAVLNQLNLPTPMVGGDRTQLQDANFQHATLYKSYLVGANLYNAVFNRANLDRANLEGATLISAHFQDADLQNACLRSTALQDADFSNANLDKTDFRGAKNLNLVSVKKAKQYQNALYDESVALELGLPPQNSSGNKPDGCNVEPRSRVWWRNLSE